MKDINKTLTLSNGIHIPVIGLGTWLMPNDKAPEVVKSALALGYRHIDTAQAYENEEGVGLGVKEAGVKRSDVFITSKIAAEIKTYEGAKNSIQESLKKLGTDYIDLMLIHCVQPWRDYVQKNPYRYDQENLDVWKAMEEAYQAGQLKAIGVSNFNERDIENILNHASIKPMVNQICLHIGETPLDVVKYCQKEEIVVEAYSPIAHGKALNHPVLQAMAQAYHTTVAALCIKYCLTLGCVALPKASSVPHLKDNLNLDFEISPSDMTTLLKLEL